MADSHNRNIYNTSPKKQIYSYMSDPHNNIYQMILVDKRILQEEKAIHVKKAYL